MNNDDKKLGKSEYFELREKRLKLVYRILYAIVAIWIAVFIFIGTEKITAQIAPIYAFVLAASSMLIINIVKYALMEFRCMKVIGNIEESLLKQTEERYECKALEIKNAPQALSRLEEDERFTTIISNDSAASGKSKLSFVNEAGLYSLILSSRKPEAKAFKRWVTHEVIPAIRKTGGYLSEPLLQRIQNDPAVIFEFADALLAERRRATALEAELSKAKPKADYFDAFINPDDCTNIRTTAKELKIPERKFVQFLLKEKFLFRSPSGQLLPYNKQSNEGLFIVRDFVTFSFTGSQTYFTPKGKEIIRLKYMKKQNELAALLPKES